MEKDMKPALYKSFPFTFIHLQMFIRRNQLLLLLSFIIITGANAQQSTENEFTISLSASGMQYDKVRFSVKPGTEVKVILVNKDDMSHNLVFTQPGAREEIVNAALKLGEGGLKANYVPASDKILAFIPVISPDQTASVIFTAPEVSGIYPYVCTFPGHGFIMYGAMYVTNEPMPPMQHDLNIPPGRRVDEGAIGTIQHSGELPKKMEHPYPLVPPYLFRIFLPDTGPDAIAVSLPQKLSYCWDAGTCRLRYAWQGDFLDFSAFRENYKKNSVKILGTVFYRDKTPFPLRIEDPENIPSVEFKGYRLIDGYPEFHYTINGMNAYEIIHAKPDGSGLIRTFRIPGAGKTIWFAFNSGDGVNYSCSKGKWVNGKLKLTSAEAQEFIIIMTRNEGKKL